MITSSPSDLNPRKPVVILLDDQPSPCRDMKLYKHNENYQKLRKFRIDNIAMFYKKREYLECLESCEDSYSIRKFIRKYPLMENNDIEFMKRLVLCRGWLIRYASKQLTSDKSFMMKVVKEHQLCFRYASDDLRSDRELLEAALDLSSCGNDLQKLMRKVDYSDHDTTGIVSLFRYPTRIFKYVTCDKLRNDQVLKNKAKEIKSNRELVLQAVKYYGSVIRYTNSKFKSDVEAARIAIENRHLTALKWFNKDLLTTQSVLAFQLVMNRETNLQYTQFYKYCGEDFWRMVVENKLLPPIVIPKKFFNLKEVIEYAQYDESALRNAFDGTIEIDDEQIFKLVTNTYPGAFKYASEKLKHNLTVLLPFLTKNPSLVEFASKEIRSNMEVANKILKRDASGLEFFDDSIRNNLDLIFSLISVIQVPTVKKLSKEVRGNKELIEKLVKRNYQFFSCATKHLRNDLEFVKKLFNIHYDIATLIPDSLKDDIELMKFVIAKHPLLFKYFSRRLRSRLDILNECLNYAFKQYFDDDRIYEHVICYFFGKIEFRSELIALHQKFSLKLKPSLRYAHPMLYFDREYFHSIYGKIVES